MSTKSNQVFLNQIFDEAVKVISDVLDASAYQEKSPVVNNIQSNYCNSNLNSMLNSTIKSSGTVTDCVITTTGGNSTFGLKYEPYVQPLSYYYQPIIWVDVLRDFTPSCSTDSSYPKTNFSCDKDGNVLIEIACTGFESDELNVAREDLKIIVEGKRKDKEKAEDRKYFYKNVACRDFKREFVGSEKWNFDKLTVAYSNGLLSIAIPLKEEFQPVRQKYEIK